MNNFRHIKLKRLLYKALGYRLFSSLLTFIVILFFTKDLTVSLGGSLIAETLKTCWYFLYDFMISKKWRLSYDDGFVLWFTGLPCSGKTTLGQAVSIELAKRGRNVERLDGDILREGVCKDLGFSKKDRDRNLDRVSYLSSILSRNGVGVVASFISPYKNKRDEIRDMSTNFIEVYVMAPPAVCQRRDVKGMWKKAKKGKIKNFTGVDAPYEIPKNPEMVVDTTSYSVEDCRDQIINYLIKRGLV